MNNTTKARIRSIYVKAKDWLHGTPFACKHTTQADEGVFCHHIQLTQPFKPSPTLDSKKHNLREAARCINTLIIRPGEVFSFWHTVGNPNNTKRFREGRSIHAGVLSIDVGGGLCQASGIIHHLALIAGLQIIERHNHSVDLYTDETRFAPLGTDATIFYGFKDLRLRNTLPYPIRFQLVIEDTQIRALLQSTEPLQEQALNFDIQVDAEGNKHVKVISPAGSIVSASTYAPLTQH